MSPETNHDVAALQHELAKLKTSLTEAERKIAETGARIVEIEQRLETRIAAAEARQAADVEAINRKWSDISTGMGALAANVGNLSTQIQASHHSLVHLLAVTARQVRVPDKDLNEALRTAKEAVSK